MDQVFVISELLTQILSHINDGTTYKVARLVSSQWYIAATDRIDEFSNHLLTLIDKFPDADWNWERIAGNPNTPIKFIINMEGPNSGRIKCPPNSDFRRTLIRLIENPNMTFEILKKFSPAFGKYMHREEVAAAPYITPNIIESNPDILWNWSAMTHNPNLTWEFFKKHSNKINGRRTICMNRCITWEIVKDNPDILWDYDVLAANPNITLDMIAKFPIVPCGLFLSVNPNLTWEYIIMNPNSRWDWCEISKHPNITWEIIKRNLTYPWIWSCVVRNPNIQFHHLNEIAPVYKNFSPIHMMISLNPNITWRTVVNNPDIEWDFSILSMNTFGKKNYKMLLCQP